MLIESGIVNFWKYTFTIVGEHSVSIVTGNKDIYVKYRFQSGVNQS